MKNIIAIIGRAGSGKDVAGDYLSEKLGIPSFTISDALKIAARERNIEESRENLIELGKEFAEKYGEDYLAKIIIKNTASTSLIIVGMRQVGQLEHCKKYHNTIFIGVESDSKTRYKRLTENKKTSGSYEQFLEIELLDEGKLQNVGKCLKYCSETIYNDDTIQGFKQRLDAVAIK